MINYTVNTNKLTKSWDAIFYPLCLPFYSPKNFIHSHSIEDINLIGKNPNDYMIKDGVLGLLPIIQFCYKNINGQQEFIFNIPTYLAPIIPNSIRKYFQFYDFESCQVNPLQKKDTLILFVSAIKNFHNIEIFKTQLNEINPHIKKIHILKNPLDQFPYHYLTNQEYDIRMMIQIIDYLINKFPNAYCQSHTSQYEISNLDFKNAYYVNTNHHYQYIGLDFLSYISFFKTGITSTSTFSKNSNYKMIKAEKIIRDLKINYFEYNGNSLLEESEINNLLLIRYPKAKKGISLEKYYNNGSIQMSDKLITKLFNFHSNL